MRISPGSLIGRIFARPLDRGKQLVLWAAALIFAAASAPVALQLVVIGRRLGNGESEGAWPPLLSLYPVAVAASATALIAAGYVASS